MDTISMFVHEHPWMTFILIILFLGVLERIFSSHRKSGPAKKK